MDTTKTITHVSLCAGYGGIDLGLHRAIRGLRTIAYSEIEAFACANLVSKMEAGLLDAAPIWTDLKTFPWSEFRDRVDILSGGYPCQPFSAAGKRGGADDPRHLWPYIADGIVRMRPRVCLFENVEGHISLGLSTVISDLEELGYGATWGIFSASEVGAPHQRKRVFILANRNSNGLLRNVTKAKAQSPGNQPQDGVSGEDGQLAHRKGEGLEGHDGLLARCNQPRWEPPQQAGQAGGGDCLGDVWPSRPGELQHEWEPPRVVGNAEAGRSGEGGDETRKGQGHRAARPSRSDDQLSQAQPTLGRDADGSAHRLDDAELYITCDNRTDELRLLGNGVVPAVAALAWRVLSKELSCN